MNESHLAVTIETVHLLYPLPADGLLHGDLAARGRRVRAHHDLETFLRVYRDDGPACVVVDLAQVEGGATALRNRLAAAEAALAVVVVVDPFDVATAVAACKAGAADVLARPVGHAALRAAVHGALYRDMVRRQAEVARREARTKVRLLTAREREVLEHVVAGLPSRKIGQALGITQKTVEAHRSNITTKLETRNVAELVYLAMQAGIIAAWP